MGGRSLKTVAGGLKAGRYAKPIIIITVERRKPAFELRNGNKGIFKIVASGSMSGREAESYKCTMSIADWRLSCAVDFRGARGTCFKKMCMHHPCANQGCTVVVIG